MCQELCLPSQMQHDLDPGSQRGSSHQPHHNSAGQAGGACRQQQQHTFAFPAHQFRPFVSFCPVVFQHQIFSRQRIPVTQELLAPQWHPTGMGSRAITYSRMPQCRCTTQNSIQFPGLVSGLISHLPPLMVL